MKTTWGEANGVWVVPIQLGILGGLFVTEVKYRPNKILRLNADTCLSLLTYLLAELVI